MVCVYCGNATNVTNSRLHKKLNRVWRRRQCATCHSVFTTIEQADEQRSFMIQASAKQLLPFSRDKLFISLHHACGHRRTAVPDAAALTDTIVAKLIHERDNGLVTKTEIRRVVLDTLSRFDQAAAIAYAAYHQA